MSSTDWRRMMIFLEDLEMMAVDVRECPSCRSTNPPYQGLIHRPGCDLLWAEGFARKNHQDVVDRERKTGVVEDRRSRIEGMMARFTQYAPEELVEDIEGAPPSAFFCIICGDPIKGKVSGTTSYVAHERCTRKKNTVH